MSEIKVNKISPRTNCGTTQLGDSGDTITIPAGVTISNSGTASGFGSTGEISWDTTVKTGDFTGVSGVGYFVNTAGGAVAVTLPGSPSAGNVIGISDYNSTSGTNNITINRNSNKINGGTQNLIISKPNAAIQLVYIDATTGWQSVFTGNTADISKNNLVASGGTETTSGDYKIHTFTGPGTFTVSQISDTEAENTVSYTVIAGGGGGGTMGGGGGGAGGFREFKGPADCYTASPLNGSTPITVAAQGYPITVGAGGAPSAGSCPNVGSTGANGNPSVFSTITSTAGGGGGSRTGSGSTPAYAGNSGGSGGGAGRDSGPPDKGGAGNTPPVSPAQGFKGGYSTNSSASAGGGGGGASAAGGNGNPNDSAGPGSNGAAGAGGAGVATSITGSPVTRAGGGGGGSNNANAPLRGLGGAGGGGPGGMDGSDGGSCSNATDGTVNTGSGGGGGSQKEDASPSSRGGSGGSGIVIIRYKFQ